MALAAEELDALVALTTSSEESHARIAEHLVRALLALNPKRKPDASLAREHLEIASRKLLQWAKEK